MMQIERTRRDSVLRGRGYSIALGANDNGSTLTPSDHGNLLKLPSTDLLNDDDLLLDAMEESTLLEDLDKDYNDKLLDFEEAMKSEAGKSSIVSDLLSPDTKIFEEEEDYTTTPVT